MASAKTKAPTRPETRAQSAASATTNAPAAEPAIKSLIVTAKVAGFRRAGRAWGTTAETVSTDEFSDEQIEALLAEPMLDVVAVTE